MPAFANQQLQDRTLYWEHEGNAAVRTGDWKLVRLGGRGPWELYDLAADRTEQHDLAAKYPDRVAQMVKHWNAWAARCHVNPNGLPKKRKTNRNKTNKKSAKPGKQ